jgi:hypothetical protein
MEYVSWHLDIKKANYNYCKSPRLKQKVRMSRDLSKGSPECRRWEGGRSGVGNEKGGEEESFEEEEGATEKYKPGRPMILCELIIKHIRHNSFPSLAVIVAECLERVNRASVPQRIRPALLESSLPPTFSFFFIFSDKPDSKTISK